MAARNSMFVYNENAKQTKTFFWGLACIWMLTRGAAQGTIFPNGWIGNYLDNHMWSSKNRFHRDMKISFLVDSAPQFLPRWHVIPAVTPAQATWTPSTIIHNETRNMKSNPRYAISEQSIFPSDSTSDDEKFVNLRQGKSLRRMEKITLTSRLNCRTNDVN